MSLQAIPLDQISAADLDQLKAASTRESRAIEYKRQLTLTDDPAKKEFLADIASFANAGGGDIVYGISESDGVPTDVVGLKGFEFDKEVLRMNSLLASWVDPRIAGVGFQMVARPSGDPVLVVRVPRSWGAPHMVTYNGVDRFFSRTANGKYPLDVREIRDAFVGNYGRLAKLRDFRLDRIARIAAGDIGERLASGYAVVVHLLPLAELPTFDYRKIIDMQVQFFAPMASRGWSAFINFDGCIVTSNNGTGEVYSYVQIFRNGAIEAVFCSPASQSRAMISPGYETEVRGRFGGYVEGLKQLGLGFPMVFGLTHTFAQGMTMFVQDSGFRFTEPRKIDRQHLLVPEIILEEQDADWDSILKRSFDIVCNACGLVGSRNFNESGKWTGGARG